MERLRICSVTPENKENQQVILLKIGIKKGVSIYGNHWEHSVSMGGLPPESNEKSASDIMESQLKDGGDINSW